MAQKDTAKSILNAAEELFSERGFAETSLRNITTRAGVNLAAVNYHFGSKKELIQAVFARFLTPFCVDLEQVLKAYEEGLQERTPQLPELLELLAATALKAGKGNPRRIGIFMRLLGLAYAQSQGHLRRFLRQEYGTLFGQYMNLVTLASPELTAEERFWRIHFMLGATVFTLSGVESLTAMAEHDLGQTTDTAGVMSRLVPFLSAGFAAPHQADS
ncbi:TetR/AcrR family transcriptional regulator [Parathalassolituus penaei]|uniref:TetR/AcrR family transcriptional regulator n=1 Tax=Parathalassolituus penaei TaxID=2997323 RepID=A0A9X3IQY5_9GAMM|nr:TetR/AcrR family transcriptional regulator [Parathalassolituus penaei]MCY0964657.1 TetR/AcrR family transcriptional regulator [Parathalassolituus penaei]